MERELDVYADLAGQPILVGRLWSRVSGSKESASFEYEPGWLKRRDGFAVDPELPSTLGQFHTDCPLFRAFTDPAPDRWGQNLLRRHERLRARREGRRPRTLLAVDFLVLVDDETRLGALRFKQAGGEHFLSTTGRPVPPVVDLPRLLGATRRILDETETEEDLRLLLAPGTSLGGARPKASVRDRDGHLLVAKFPRPDDDWPVTRWEAAALAMAAAAGVDVPPSRMETVLRRPVVLLRRFDRQGSIRIPFMSSLTALVAADHDARGYLDIVEVLRRDGAQVERDLRQLWRRVVFNILVSNTDDHLRNHGFLRERRGWRLAPAYDLNPTPVDVKPRVHALAIDEVDATASLEAALSVAPKFGIANLAQAREIAAEVGAAVARWRAVAARFGITPAQAERMASAFEHDDLHAALGEGPRRGEQSRRRRRSSSVRDG